MIVKKNQTEVKSESSVDVGAQFKCLSKVMMKTGVFAEPGELVNFEDIDTKLDSIELIRHGILKRL